MASKKIPCVNEEGKTQAPQKPNGWKLEMFIFDVFPNVDTLVAYEVQREEEFAPLKNAPGSHSDCPETCRHAVSELHKKWLSQCGAKVVTATDSHNVNNDSNNTKHEEKLCEISPLVAGASDDLSDLEALVRGKTFTLPCVI